MKKGRFSSFTSLALTALVCLALITIFEWVDRLICLTYPTNSIDCTSAFHHVRCCIAAFSFCVTSTLELPWLHRSIIGGRHHRKDLEGRIIFWNGGAERIYGYSRKRSRGSPYPSSCHRRDRRYFKHSGENKKGESVAHFETVRLRKDGSRVPVSLTVSPLRNAWQH